METPFTCVSAALQRACMRACDFRWVRYSDVLRRSTLQNCYNVCSGTSIWLCTRHEQLSLERRTTQVVTRMVVQQL